MSTCPNEELFCAFFDDEVPLLLKEELEIHLLKCKKCRQFINKYKIIKASLSCNEIESLDLEQSFEKLISKRKSVQDEEYKTFSIKMKYRIIASTVASVFLFAFLFIFLKNNSSYDKTYTLHKGEVQCTLIVPMSYRRHSNIITNIDLHNMTSVIKTNRKQNRKICKNFTNTFNNFTCLYTSLENNTNNFDITIPNINEEIPYNYGTNMSIYANLNQNAK